MVQFFHEGGAGMFPTALFGVLLFITAVVHAVKPDRRLGPVVATLAAMVVAAGLLAASLGISATTQHLWQVPPANQLVIFGTGLAESLNNVVLAMLVLVPSCMVAAVGALRAAKRTATA